MWYKNIAGRFFELVTKHACDGQTDRRTDRQNYDSKDRASTAASHGKNLRRGPRPWYRDQDLQKLDSSALKTRDLGVEITGLNDKHVLST